MLEWCGRRLWQGLTGRRRVVLHLRVGKDRRLSSLPNVAKHFRQRRERLLQAGFDPLPGAIRLLYSTNQEAVR